MTKNIGKERIRHKGETAHCPAWGQEKKENR